ncbi:MAG: type I phosphomannose isomerase catalytic subunit [Pirellulaceae bacterium]
MRFLPVFRHYLWGGERLRSHLGKSFHEPTAAESWEIVDHANAQSIVLNGELAGRELHDLMQEYGADLVGDQCWSHVIRDDLPDNLKRRFPLLIKFLDANSDLSVQVHPNDRQAAQQDVPDLGKTEAWYVVDAKSGSRIFAGLKMGVTKRDFAAAIDAGTTDSCLHSFEAQAGGCVLVPAGTQHAIGAGCLILEVQQASDTTYRVFDWNRVDANGNSRELHVDQAMRVTNFERGPIHPIEPVVLDNGSLQLAQCEYFSIKKFELDECEFELGEMDRFEIICVIQGELKIEDSSLKLGQTILLPPGHYKTNALENGTKFLRIVT